MPVRRRRDASFFIPPRSAHQRLIRTAFWLPVLAASVEALHSTGSAPFSRKVEVNEPLDEQRHKRRVAAMLAQGSIINISQRDFSAASWLEAARVKNTTAPRGPPFRIYGTSRIGHWRDSPLPRKLASPGVRGFFGSAVASEWVFFFMALTGFIMLHSHMLEWPSRRRNYSLALFIWFVAAGFCNLLVDARLGPVAARKWLCGYFLELVFSMENVFIFHIITSALKTPRRQAQRALFVVVICQMLFQMVFFMGLADWLQSIKVLPYLLGIWLVYLGVETLRKGDDHGGFDVHDTSIFKAFRSCLGNRLSLQYPEGSALFHREEGMIKMTMIVPCIACLLLADFVMEVDVTLTKIEGIHNHYIGFTSSAAAAFAMPTLFFVARDLFSRYALLKYGITFVLVFFGMELLLHEWINIPDMFGIVIILVVLTLCVALSIFFEARGPRLLRRFSDDTTFSHDGEETTHSKMTDTSKADQNLNGGEKRLPVNGLSETKNT